MILQKKIRKNNYYFAKNQKLSLSEGKTGRAIARTSAIALGRPKGELLH